MALVVLLLAVLTVGAAVYSLLVVVAVWDYLGARRPKLPAGQAVGQASRPAIPAPISILKPLAGLDEGLEENLRSFFRQDYPNFEILFAVRDAADPAVALVTKLRSEFPDIPSQLIVTGEPPYPNSKVYSLHRMVAESHHDLIVMSDSDVRVTPGMLQAIAAEFQDPILGLATCPYRAVPGMSIWSRLEAIGLNTEFLAGILVARIVEGVKFGVGPAMAVQRKALARIGGMERLKDYLAEDFMLGKLIAESGYRTILSSYVIEHRIGSESLRANFEHRLRWVRSTRRSRPSGYAGQVFTYPIPLALLLTAADPAWWPALAVAAALRAWAAWTVARQTLDDRLTGMFWCLLPVQDVLSFAFWIAGFFGNHVTWRGRTYLLHADGRFEAVASPQAVNTTAQP